MKGFDIRVEGGCVTLDFSSIDLDAEIVAERVQEILPLLERLLEADLVREALPETILVTRFRAIAAQSMMCQASLAAATRQAALLIDITDGSESIADHGFPEFKDGEDIDV